MHDHDPKVPLTTRLFSDLGVQLCSGALQIAGQTLTPDDTKAYVEFNISHSWPAVSAYNVASHPQTIQNSYRSLLHQVFDLGHELVAYNPPKDAADPYDETTRRDWVLGSIVAVELMNPPMGATLPKSTEKSTYVRAAAVIHKNLQKVPKILGEHLGGRHKWTVSMEADYLLSDSGLVLQPMAPGGAVAPEVQELCAASTPREFASEQLLYIPWTSAPDELKDCYNYDERRIDKPYRGMRPTILKGGINGSFHFNGVGLVRYGAEREAEIQQILASDPDKVWDVWNDGARGRSHQDDGSRGRSPHPEYAAVLEYFRNASTGLSEIFKKPE